MTVESSLKGSEEWWLEGDDFIKNKFTDFCFVLSARRRIQKRRYGRTINEIIHRVNRPDIFCPDILLQQFFPLISVKKFVFSIPENTSILNSIYCNLLERDV